MPNIGPAEILVILVVALLVFGPQKLPEIGRQVGKAMREVRRMQASLRDEVRDVLDPPASQSRPAPSLEPGSLSAEETAARDRRSDEVDRGEAQPPGDDGEVPEPGPAAG